MNKKNLKTVSIKGKDYVTVAQRILFFNETYPKGCIISEVNCSDEVGIVRVQAKVYPEGIGMGLRYFTGHAEESRTSSMVNKTSAVENCETSAVGRALGLMGIGIIDGIASADEVHKAINTEKVVDVDPRLPKRDCDTCGKAFSLQPGKEWAKTCFSCFKNKAVKSRKSIVTPLKDERYGFTMENATEGLPEANDDDLPPF